MSTSVRRKSQRKRSLASALSTTRPASAGGESGGWERGQLLAATRAERRHHSIGPVLNSRLPAVEQHVPERLPIERAECPGNRCGVVAHVLLDVGAIELVHLVARCRGHGGEALRARGAAPR